MNIAYTFKFTKLGMTLDESIASNVRSREVKTGWETSDLGE